MSIKRTHQSKTNGNFRPGPAALPLHAGAAGPVAAVALPGRAQYRLTCQLVARLPIGKVFQFFEDAGNLARITPPWLHFEMRTKNGFAMGPGAEIDYVIRWQRLPMKWKTLITEYRPPSYFVDEQARGPYRLWRHRHEFKETAEGTIISDRVDYSLPLGPLGRMAHALIVGRQLKRIFEYRQRAIPDLLGVEWRELTRPSITAL